ncbi:MAG: aldo/keto reductase [Anaerolineae bacterium]|jgi:predicted aldo/keto reductase-like oxidoreductase|nr:aldo/keto reductase [Anaerolineae bacterium]
MQYRKFGKLDWNVSALGFGAMRLPSSRFRGVDRPEAIRIMQRGIDLGINYVDTAWPYHLGESEKVVGEALKDGYREKVYLVTKLPVFLMRKTEEFDHYLNQQLERLQQEYVDMYLLHSLNAGYWDKVQRLGLIEKMEEAKRQGRIRHFGFSFHDTYPVFKEIIDAYDWDMTQIQYNYMDTVNQARTEGLQYAHSKGIAVVIMEPLRGGQLANPPLEALDIMKASPIKRTPVDWALQFLWNQPEVATVLSGMSDMQMVEENCASADASGIGSLSEEEEATIEAIADIYRQKILVPCTGCEYCMPCPFGVNIPKNFAILNSVNGAKGFQSVQMRMGYNRLVGNKDKVDKAHPDGNASICVQCGVCVEKCPQSINIPEELKKVDAILGKFQRISKHFPEK